MRATLLREIKAQKDYRSKRRRLLKQTKTTTSSDETEEPKTRPYRRRDSIREKKTCAICLNAENDISNPAHTDACSHVFCFDCLLRWSEMANRCPMCKLVFHEIRSRERRVPVKNADMTFLLQEEDFFCHRCGAAEWVLNWCFHSVGGMFYSSVTLPAARALVIPTASVCLPFPRETGFANSVLRSKLLKTRQPNHS